MLGFALAAPAGAVDLLQSYRAALAHDPVLASAEAAHRGGVEVLSQARSALGPVVQAQGSELYERARPLPGTPVVSGRSTAASLNLTQPLFHRGDMIGIDSAHSQVARLDAQWDAARLDLFLRVSQAYFNVLLAQDNLALTRSEKDAIGQQLAQARRSFEVGTVAITDVHEAQARFDLSAATEIQNVGDLDIAREALNHLTGIVSPQVDGLASNYPLAAPQPDDVQHWLALAETNNPAVVQATALLDSQHYELDRTEVSNWPTVDLAASLSHQTYSNTELYTNSNTGKVASIGVQVNWTLWDAGMRNSRVRQASAGLDQAREDLRNAKNMASQAVRQAYIGTTTAVAQLQALDQAVTSAQSSLEASTKGREVGYRTSIDVLNARQLLFQTMRQVTATRYTVVLDTLQLKALVADLAESDLAGVTGAPRAP